jgi:hypothetical protein
MISSQYVVFIDFLTFLGKNKWRWYHCQYRQRFTNPVARYFFWYSACWSIQQPPDLELKTPNTLLRGSTELIPVPKPVAIKMLRPVKDLAGAIVTEVMLIMKKDSTFESIQVLLNNLLAYFLPAGNASSWQIYFPIRESIYCNWSKRENYPDPWIWFGSVE